MSVQLQNYKNNPKLKRVGQDIPFERTQIEEYIKCKNDVIYFLNNYFQIVTIDKGKQIIKLWDYQEDIINLVHQNRNTIVLSARQISKTTTVCGYILHYILFNSSKNVAILANYTKTARKSLRLIKQAYEHIPLWMQQGILSWNVNSIELENGCTVMVSASTGDSIRGETINLLYVDECAFVDNFDIFWSATYPTISSGTSSKVVMTSTPKGLNHFYKFWTEAEAGVNDFIPYKVMWYQRPDRGEEWKKKTVAQFGEEKFLVEHCCQFLGSTATLIASTKLKDMAIERPVKEIDNLKIYRKVQDEHNYVIVADVSKGREQDFSVFSVIDVSMKPFKVVAVFRDNTIQPIIYARVIHNTALKYNKAYILVEENNIGSQVTDVLSQDLEYENMFTTVKRDMKTTLSSGFHKNAKMGITTTARVKRIGCSNLKMLIEKEQLLVTDSDTIGEFLTFSVDAKSGSYKAENGKHDDCIMTLVLFSWMVDEEYFKELYDNDIRENLMKYVEEKENEENYLPFGFLNDGIDEFISPSFEEDTQREDIEILKQNRWLFDELPKLEN
jgi:hypothetical protein